MRKKTRTNVKETSISKTTSIINKASTGIVDPTKDTVLRYDYDTKQMERVNTPESLPPAILFNDSINNVHITLSEHEREIGSVFYIDLENNDTHISYKINKSNLERDDYRQDLLSIPVLEKYAKECEQHLIRETQREILNHNLDIELIRKAFRAIVKDQDAISNLLFMKRTILNYQF